MDVALIFLQFVKIVNGPIRKRTKNKTREIDDVMGIQAKNLGIQTKNKIEILSWRSGIFV
jgi:hypothetical protein